MVNNKYYPLLLGLAALFFVTLFSRATSFLYVFEGADPSIFKQMGRAILKGKIIYVDYFDNKGCLLYFIHAFGLWLGGDFAIMLMQVVSLTATLLIWDKILALYRTEKERVICLCIALVLLLCFYGAGDQTQEWCLPFISYPLLVYFRAYKSKTEIRPLQTLVIGICFGIITFIQINNACAFLGFIAYHWIQLLVKKEFKQLLSNLGCLLCGWLVIAIPCVLYFYIVADGNGVYEMFYASFLSNFEYIGIQKIRQWFYWFPYFLLILSFICVQILNYDKEKVLLIPILVSTLLFILTFGKLCNSFYLMSILPLCIVNLSTIDTTKHRKPNRVLNGTILFCALFMGSISIFHIVNDLILGNEKEQSIYRDFHRCITNIPETERDSIYNYNLFWHGYNMMEHEELLQCNRVSIAYDLPSLMKEEASRSFVPPKWIMISPNKRYYPDDVAFILENYELLYYFHYDRTYFQKPKIGVDFDVQFFRHKKTP